MDQIVCGIRRHCDAGFFRTSSAEMEQKNMEQYATQMEAARKGIVTEELKKVAAKERMTTEELMPLVAEGRRSGITGLTGRHPFSILRSCASIDSSTARWRRPTGKNMSP